VLLLVAKLVVKVVAVLLVMVMAAEVLGLLPLVGVAALLQVVVTAESVLAVAQDSTGQSWIISMKLWSIFCLLDPTNGRRLQFNIWSSTNWCIANLKRKFWDMCSHQPPTGDPTCPPYIVSAKRIQHLIEERLDAGNLDGEEADIGFDDVNAIDGGEEGAVVEAEEGGNETNVQRRLFANNVPVARPLVRTPSSASRASQGQNVSNDLMSIALGTFMSNAKLKEMKRQYRLEEKMEQQAAEKEEKKERQQKEQELREREQRRKDRQRMLDWEDRQDWRVSNMMMMALIASLNPAAAAAIQLVQTNQTNQNKQQNKQLEPQNKQQNNDN
jgi:hypothetical protein